MRVTASFWWLSFGVAPRSQGVPRSSVALRRLVTAAPRRGTRCCKPPRSGLLIVSAVRDPADRFGLGGSDEAWASKGRPKAKRPTALAWCLGDGALGRIGACGGSVWVSKRGCECRNVSHAVVLESRSRSLDHRRYRSCCLESPWHRVA